MARASSSGSPRRPSASTARPSRSTDTDRRLVVLKQADRRLRRDHAVELPDRDDHAQGRAGAGGRLPGRDQAGRADAAVGAGAGRAGRARRHPRRACSTSSPATPRARSRSAELLCNSDVVRHLTFTGSTEVGRLLMAPMRADGQEALAGARRQRALHRLRRRRPRRGGRGRDGQQVPQRRPDLRLRQPPATCRTASTTSSSRSSPPRSRALKVGNGFDEGVNQGPLIDEAALAKVEEPRRRRARQGRARAGWRPAAQRWAAASSSRPCWPTSRRRCCCAREETFGPVAPLFRFQTEAGGDRRWPTRPNSAWRATSTAATSAASGASARRSSTAWSASTSA